VVVKIPDSTPEIIRASALGDEQALLALVRYNRLIDVFLGLTAYSLQNHLRTTAPGIGQAEVDEVYVAVDRHGAQYVLPVQAKGGNDQIGVVQAEQDIAVCHEKFSGFTPRPIAAQFMADGVIALFELTVQEDEIRVVREAHYRLVPHSEITDADRAAYRSAAGL
jgi:acyl transferase domain-containing protein